MLFAKVTTNFEYVSCVEIWRMVQSVPFFRWFSPHHLVASFLSQRPGFNLRVNRVKLVHKAAINRFLFMVFGTSSTNCHSTSDPFSICITAGTLGTSENAVPTNWVMKQMKNNTGSKRKIRTNNWEASWIYWAGSNTENYFRLENHLATIRNIFRKKLHSGNVSKMRKWAATK